MKNILVIDDESVILDVIKMAGRESVIIRPPYVSESLISVVSTLEPPL
jgi:hypothetical protein